ncbi:MAG: 50S ribosomal protein L24 [Planctomycetota bacterium]|nr:MAG: 50S ribosomal protein L24 [Planctomycetota bacterium]
MHIRRNDLVVVITGKAKPRKKTAEAVTPRKVLKCFPKENRVIVEQTNYIWKHVRRSDKYPQGGRVQKEAPIHVSNLMLWCENCARPVRIGIRRAEKVIRGRTRRVKERVCKKCSGVIEPRKK